MANMYTKTKPPQTYSKTLGKVILSYSLSAKKRRYKLKYRLMVIKVPPKLELIKSSVKGKIKSQRIFAPNFIEQKIKHLRCNIFFHFTAFDNFNRRSEY